jgi:hypothetical protein
VFFDRQVDSDMPEITCLTITQANSTQKHSFAKIVELMNQRGPIRAQQRKASGKRTRREAEEEDRDSEDNSRVAEGGDAPGSAGTGDVIWVQIPQARRRRTEPSAPNSSPSAGLAARSAAGGIERGGRGSRGGRVTRSTRGRSVAC